MNEAMDMLESACRSTRISIGDIRSEREARELIAWAESSLRLAYGADDHELSYDTSDMKRTAFELRYAAKQYLNHNKYSDIVTLCNSLAEQLGKACDALCPELSVYLQARVRLGTY